MAAPRFLRRLWAKLKAAWLAFKTPEAPPPTVFQINPGGLPRAVPFPEHGRFRVIEWRDGQHWYLYPLWKGQDSGAEARRVFEQYQPKAGEHAIFYDGVIERGRKG